jgi:cephalosporin hydroxylase
MTANGRSFDSALTPPLIDAVQKGALRWTYRGVECQKNPFDLAIYTMLIGRLQPRTVLEIGTFNGGSALWFADMLDAHRITGSRVVTLDIDPHVAEPDPRVTYVTGSALALDQALSPELLAQLPRPWLAIDDGGHTEELVSAAIEWLHPHLQSGDYLVVEDGNLRHFSDPFYDYFNDGPNRALVSFLEKHGADYEIDQELCDWFGYNVTWNLNGWLRRR